MNVMTTKMAGIVWLRSVTSEVAPALSPITSAAVPPPNFALKALKWDWKSALFPNRRTTKATSVPTIAITKKMFCQRKVVFVPAMRIAVMSAIIEKPPRKTHSWWSFWSLKLRPHSTSVWLPVTAPIETRTGPSAETAK